MFASLGLSYRFQGKPESAFTDARESERMSDGRSELVKTKWPRWLDWNRTLKPSAVILVGIAVIPALLTSNTLDEDAERNSAKTTYSE